MELPFHPGSLVRHFFAELHLLRKLFKKFIKVQHGTKKWVLSWKTLVGILSSATSSLETTNVWGTPLEATRSVCLECAAPETWTILDLSWAPHVLLIAQLCQQFEASFDLLSRHPMWHRSTQSQRLHISPTCWTNSWPSSKKLYVCFFDLFFYCPEKSRPRKKWLMVGPTPGLELQLKRLHHQLDRLGGASWIRGQDPAADVVAEGRSFEDLSQKSGCVSYNII